MSVEVIWDDVKVEFWNAGEGWCGDYNENDPHDENLLRFDVMIRRNSKGEDVSWVDEWEHLEDASYCTQVPASLSQARLTLLATIIMDRVYDDVQSGNSIKKICEELSWIGPDWLKEVV